MGYYGHKPAAGENNSFKILDDLSSYTLTFDGTSSAVVSAANDTLNFNNHRFVQGQRVTYTNGGAANIGGLTTGSVYYIIKHDNNHIKLATSASNASSSTAINLTAVAGSGTSHTLNVAFDGTNTKFKITHSSGVKGNVTRAAQLILSVNGVIQQGHDTPTPSSGYGIDSDSTIVFETAPSVGYNFWGNIVANNFASFEITDNKIDVFTGDGTTKNFSLSKTPTNNENVLVTLDGVVQYPSDSTTTRAYSVVGNSLEFSGAPAAAVDIQARHIGFAGGSGGSSGGVTGFYGRTGNVVLKNTDDIVAESAVIGAGVTIHANGAHVTGVVTATSFVGALTGNADTSTTAGTVTTAAQTNITSLGTLTSLNVSGNTSIGGVLTYEDVTNVDSIGVVTARSGIRIGAGGTIGPSTGAGIVTYFGDGSNLTGISGGVDSDDERNTKAGDNAGDSFDGTNATDNTLIGYDAGTAITTGDKNTLVGSYAGDSATTSSNITAIGYYAASTISTQSAFTGVTAVGSNACKTSVGVRNSVVGFDALKTGSSAAYNCIFGNEAARQSDGSNNIVIGDSALLYGTSSASYNVAIGRNAFVGHNSNCVSDHSVSIGYESLYNTNRTTARANIAIGSSAGKTITTGRNNIIIGDSAEATSATTNNEITLGNSSTTKFRIPGLDYYNDEGKIGIGTDNPTAALDVRDSDGTDSDTTPTFFVGHSNADVIGEAIRIGRVAPYSTIRYHSIKAEHSGGTTSNMLAFHLHNGSSATSQTEVLRLRGDGYIGIGTISPDSRLSVYSGTAGSVSADGDADELTLESSGNTGMSILSPGDKESSIYFGNPGTNGQKEAWLKYIHETHDTIAKRRSLRVKVAGTECAYFDSTGLVMANDKGLSFINADDTATGETVSGSVLADYEEGTWLPTLTFGGTAAGGYNSRSGSYIKIGTFVYLVGQLDLSAVGSGTGNAAFANLPYPAGDHVSGSSHEGSGSITWWQSMGINLNYPTSFWVSESTAGATIYQGNGSAVQVLDQNDFNNNSQFRFVIHYRTAA